MPKKKAKPPEIGRPKLFTKVVRHTVAMDESLSKAIDRAAASEGKTRSEIIRARLAAAFEKE